MQTTMVTFIVKCKDKQPEYFLNLYERTRNNTSFTGRCMGHIKAGQIQYYTLFTLVFLL